MGSKNLLLLKMSDDVPGCERDLIGHVVDPFKIVVTEVDVHAVDDLERVPEIEFDYLYVCGHANKRSVGGDGSATDRQLNIEWPELSRAICEHLAEDALLFLACCQGGLRQVAWDLFIECDLLSTVVGPAGGVDSDDIRLAFHTLIYNLEARSEEPAESVNRAINATGRQFRLYERDGVEVEQDFVAYRDFGAYCQKYPTLCAPPLAPTA